MDLFFLLIFQVFSYQLWAWVLFVFISFFSAFYLGFFFVPFGQVFIGVFIVILDLFWIKESMATKGWNGAPDLDILFFFGTLVRTIIVNSLLFPVTGFGLYMRWRIKKKGSSSESVGHRVL